MSTEPAAITLLQRREIEAKIVAPLVRAVMAELGEAKTLEVLRGVIANLAREAGADLARELGDASLPAFAQSLDRWKAGGALEIDTIEDSPERLDFNVTRCRYAEMYRALGLAELGGSLSCCRDFALVEGFNPNVTLTRTQTIMEGATHCNFRFLARSGEGEVPSSSASSDQANPSDCR